MAQANDTDGGDRTSWISTDGEDNRIACAADAQLPGRVEIRGRGNALVIADRVKVERYAPAGFGATVPEIGRRSDTSIVIEGDDNRIEIEAGVRLAMNLVVRGHRNSVRIGRDAYLHGFVNLITDDAHLSIGAETTMVQGSIQLHEAGSISIGTDCMISSQVYVSLSDIHPIHDQATGQRINPGQSVQIGDHVWLGLRTMVMKGSCIGDGAVTAAGSIVSGKVPPHSVVAGAPARVAREGIEWRRDFDPAGSPTGTGSTDGY